VYRVDEEIQSFIPVMQSLATMWTKTQKLSATSVTVSTKLLAFETSCCSRLLKVCWMKKVGNKIVVEEIERYYKIVDLIKQRKLRVPIKKTSTFVFFYIF